MYRSQGYIQYLAILFLLSPCLIEQVSSTKCYECNSDKDIKCITDSQVKDLGETECKSGIGFTKNNLASGGLNSRAEPVLEYKCVTLKGLAFNNGRTVVYRGCVQKFMTCDTIKVVANIFNQTNLNNPMQIDDCKICENDLCNSSGYLSAGIWTLSLSLLAVYLIKF